MRGNVKKIKIGIKDWWIERKIERNDGESSWKIEFLKWMLRDVGRIL